MEKNTTNMSMAIRWAEYCLTATRTGAFIIEYTHENLWGVIDFTCPNLRNNQTRCSQNTRGS